MDTEQHGGRNPLVDAARELDIFAGTRSGDRELDKLRGEKVADRIEDDPRFARVAADPEKGVEAANAGGSFEAMIAAFSGGTRPAMPGIQAAAVEGMGP